jgi:hypothetical protein
MRLRTLRSFLAFGLFSVTPAAPAATLRVPSEYATIQEALDAAEAGDTVLVAPGEYVIRRPLDFNRLRHPADPQRPPRDLALVSEAGAERTVIRMSETPEDPSEASVVVFEKGETRASRLEGFTLAGGGGRFTGRGLRGGWAGGGLLCIRSAPLVLGCRISDNRAWEGAAVYSWQGAMRIEDCIIAGNSDQVLYASGSGDDGAALEVVSSSLTNNSGRGVIAAQGADVHLSRSSLVGNTGSGISAGSGSRVELSSVIIWGNGGTPLAQSGGTVRVEHSLIEGGWPGPGNIDADPLFCGWGPKAVVHLDAGAAEEGDGSAERPFRRLESAFEYSLALAPDSPCRGAGKDGEDMGADHGTCAVAGAAARLVQAAPGSYDSTGLRLLPPRGRLSLAGAGADRTVIVGTVRWLRDGASLSGATVTGGEGGGIILEGAGEVEISDAWVQGNRGNGIECSSGALVLRRSAVRGNESSGILLSDGRADVSDSLIAENAGCGIRLSRASELRISNSTLAFNDVARSCGSQISAGAGAQATVTSSIIWGHPNSRSIALGGEPGEAAALASHCNIEGGWPGEGNIDADPLFCGWEGRLEAHVDPASPPGGDGSAGRPYARLAQALAWSFALAEGSPCRGAGEGGAHMGAELGSCAEAAAGIRTVLLAAGRHRAEGRPLVHGASLRGTGRDETVLEGQVRGLVSGVELRDLTLSGGRDGGLVIPEGESPRFARCAVRDFHASRVITCGPRSAPVFEECVFSDNNAAYEAVIACHQDSRAELIDCRIERNRGNGLLCWNASPLLLRVVISGNIGTGVVCGSASPVLRSCSITGNSRRWGGGGGIACFDGSAPLIEDCLIAWNMTDQSGGGIYCVRSSPLIRASTVAANTAAFLGNGIYCIESSPFITHSILSEHPGGSIQLADELSRPEVTYSLLDEPWPGEGNIAGDPRFCGYFGGEEVHVDPSAPAGGDGSAALPLRRLEDALDYRFALALDSPCRGAGEDGSDLGADFGACDFPGPRRRTVFLAPGAYSLRGLGLASRASLIGAGMAVTLIEGAAIGLREGEGLSRLTIRGGEPAGILVAAGESPVIEEVAVEWSAGQGVICAPRSAPRIRRSRVTSSEENGIVCGYGAAPRIESSVLTANSGYPGGHGRRYGGNLYAGPLSSPRLSGCELSRGIASGVFAVAGAAVIVERSRITANRQGGVYVSDASACLSDSLIAGNSGSAAGGWSSHLQLLGCTVAGNQGGIAGGGELLIANSIISGNAGQAVSWQGGSSFIRNTLSDVPSDEFLEGEGNSDDDPLFVEPPLWDDRGTPEQYHDDIFLGGDFRLQPDSPAIDAGTLEALRSHTDLDGAPRVCGKSVDLGAYELAAPECTSVPYGTWECGPLPALGAAFDLTPESGPEPLEIAVDASISTTAGLEVHYRWDFGDGTLAQGVRARHTYERRGRYTVGLLVSDEHGRSAASSREVRVFLVPGEVSPWRSELIGTLLKDEEPGGARREGSCLLVAAGGRPLAATLTADALRFVHRELSGDALLAARFHEPSRSGTDGAQTGLMLRASPAPEASFVAILIYQPPASPSFRARYLWRETAGAGVRSFGGGTNLPGPWLRLARQGSSFAAATSSDGVTWSAIAASRQMRAEMPAAVLGGLFGAGGGFDFEVCAELQGGGIEGGALFRRGDLTADGQFNLTDAIALLGHLFLGAPGELSCRRSADADDSGRLEITDAIYLLAFAFLGGPQPPAPFPGCGFDTTRDTLDCARYPPCD